MRGNGFKCRKCADETLLPSLCILSTADVIEPKVEPQPSTRTFPVRSPIIRRAARRSRAINFFLAQLHHQMVVLGIVFHVSGDVLLSRYRRCVFEAGVRAAHTDARVFFVAGEGMNVAGSLAKWTSIFGDRRPPE